MFKQLTEIIKNYIEWKLPKPIAVFLSKLIIGILILLLYMFVIALIIFSFIINIILGGVVLLLFFLLIMGYVIGDIYEL